MYDLSREQVIDLLEYCGASKFKNFEGKDNIQCCCPVHKEETPSFGFSLSKQTYHCFSCHSSGSASWLLVQALPDEFKSTRQADAFIKDRYGVDFSLFDKKYSKTLKRISGTDDDFEEEVNNALPMTKLAPYKSGKETYKYFYDRGFTDETLVDYKIGRDIVNMTVTIPVFFPNDTLAGIIGRYIDKNRPKNARYKIYDFSTGSVLYPMNKFKVIDDTIILVEGILDALWMHQLGYTNTLATLTNYISWEQAHFVKNNCLKVIDLSDNDEGGELASQEYKKKLKGIIMLNAKEFYPEHKKDPQQCTKEEIADILDNVLFRKVDIKRL